MSDFPITIFHNPMCGTSRNALAAIREKGFDPQVIEYVKVGWSAAQLKDLFGKMGVAARDVLRTRGTPAEELGLTAEGVSEEAIIAAMVEHPILVNRPIVATPKGVALTRPPEKVLDLLP